MDGIEQQFLPYEQFHDFSWIKGNCSTLKTLRLTYYELDSSALVDALEGCEELEELRLINVEWTKTPPTTSPMLPKLNKYKLTMHHIQVNSAEQFMALVLFRKSNNKTQESLVPSSVEVEVRSSLPGFPSLRFHPDGQRLSLTSMIYDTAQYFEYTQLEVHDGLIYPGTMKIENLTTFAIHNENEARPLPLNLVEVLKLARLLKELTLTDHRNSNFSLDLSLLAASEKLKGLRLSNIHVWSSEFVNLNKIDDLYLSRCALNLRSVSVSSSVRGLDLRDVTIIGGSLETLLVKMEGLTSLTVNYHTKTSKHIFDLSSLSNLTPTLQYLDLCGMQLSNSSPNLLFTSLCSVVFCRCEFTQIETFRYSQLFPKVTYIDIDYDALSSYSVLQDLLKMTSIENILITRTSNEIPEVTRFLLQSDVPTSAHFAWLKKSNISMSTGWYYYELDYGDSLDDPQLRDRVITSYILLLMSICGVGLLGNALSIVILTRKNMRNSTSFILLGLTLCDSLLLFTYMLSVLYFAIKLVLVFLKFEIPWDRNFQILTFEVTVDSVKNLDKLQYTLFYPLNKAAYTGSVYATALLTLERYIAVCWPLHARRMLRTKRAVQATLGVYIFAGILNFTRWIEAQQYISEVESYEVHKDTVYWKTLRFTRNTQGSGLLRNRYYRNYYHGWIWNSFMYLLPITALAFLNYKILRQLYVSKRTREELTTRTTERDNRAVEEQQQLTSLTKMIICVVMIFIVCNTGSGFIVWYFTWSSGWDPNDVEIFLCVPLVINSSINFFIYAWLGTKFRTELHNLYFSCRKVVCRC